MSDPKAHDQEPVLPKPAPEEYGWNFHKGPLIIAAILTVLFYLVVFFLASVGSSPSAP